MSNKSEYMNEYMRLKRKAKKVGKAHLPISELRLLDAAGELDVTTGSNPGARATNHTNHTHEKVPANNWVLGIVGVVGVGIGYAIKMVTTAH